MAMITYKTIIVEDEYLAAAELKKMLEPYSDIEVVQVADSVEAAVESIQKHQPHFIFLDINLNGQLGFDVLNKLPHVPHTIFITAYDQYAIKAFEVSAIDYLLKPVHPKRLEEAIEKTKKLIQPFATKENKLTIDKRIFVKDGDQCFFVPLVDVFLIESVGNYARVFYNNYKPLLHKSLNYLEEKLPETHFFRASRQHIININFIKTIHPYFNNCLQIELQNGVKIDVSQRQSVKFKELMGV